MGSCLRMIIARGWGGKVAPEVNSRFLGFSETCGCLLSHLRKENEKIPSRLSKEVDFNSNNHVLTKLFFCGLLNIFSSLQ